MASARIIPSSQIPPKETKWGAVLHAISVLSPGHTLEVTMPKPNPKSDRQAIYAGAKTMGIKITIRISQKFGPVKIYVTRLKT